jgi:hypothetical protein
MIGTVRTFRISQEVVTPLDSLVVSGVLHGGSAADDHSGANLAYRPRAVFNTCRRYSAIVVALANEDSLPRLRNVQFSSRDAQLQYPGV